MHLFVLRGSPSAFRRISDIYEPLLCCRKHCATATSRPCRGSWSCWRGCAGLCRRRGTTSTTASASYRSKETRRRQVQQTLLQPRSRSCQWRSSRRSSSTGWRREERREEWQRRTQHRVTDRRLRASTRLPDLQKATLQRRPQTTPLPLRRQQPVSLKKHQPHRRTEPSTPCLWVCVCR